jgi:predicted RNA-binding Zn-ribbon protein involved in translation (DUF1610 family)
VSIRMRCQSCGRSLYSASAPVVVARGDRCPSCGGVLELPCPSCGRHVELRGATSGAGTTHDRDARDGDE